MCVTPIRIENKSRVPNPVEWVKSHPLDRYKDLTSQYISVPCGHCVECIRLRQNYWIQRFRLMASCSDIYFQTLTYNPKFTPHYKCKLTNGNDFDIEVALRSDLQNYFKRVRKRNIFGSEFKYFAVSEYGGKRHRPHFHVCYFVPKKQNATLAEKVGFANRIKWKLFNEWSRNVGTNRKPLYQPLCEYHQKFKNGKLYRNYDFHFVAPSASKNGETDVGFYVSKYMLKLSDYVDGILGLLYHNLEPDDFLSAKHSVQPFLLCSKGFGFPPSDWSDMTLYNKLVSEFKERSLTSAKNGTNPLNSFLFYVNQSSFPLSPYLRKKHILADDSLKMVDIRNSKSADYFTNYDSAHFDNIDFDRVVNAEREYSKLRKHIENLNNYVDS